MLTVEMRIKSRNQKNCSKLSGSGIPEAHTERSTKFKWLSQNWEPELRGSPPPDPRLGSGWHAGGTEADSSAKPLKTELTLKPQPTKAGWNLWPKSSWLFAKTKMWTLYIGLKVDPDFYNVVFKVPRITIQNYSPWKIRKISTHSVKDNQ